MSTESFRRHTRRRVDAAIHRVCASLPPVFRRELIRFVRVAHARSDLLRALPPRAGGFPALEALRNLASFPAAFTNEPETWPGATGHPLAVVDSFARHVYGRYPVPRVLAQVWFGGDTPAERERRAWYVAHSLGHRVRALDLPVAMTRPMERVFLRSRHDLPLDHALRRAEVIGLGGSEELAAAIVATRLGRSLARGDLWRPVIAWLIRHEAVLHATEVAEVIDYAAATGTYALGSRASVLAAMQRLRIERACPYHESLRVLAWPASRWRGLAVVSDGVRWDVVELLDRAQLRHEGTAMHHCVASYAARCASGRSSIWSVRRDDVSLLTIEVDPRIGAVVQVRGVRNARGPHGAAADYARRWARQAQLEVPEEILAELAR